MWRVVYARVLRVAYTRVRRVVYVRNKPFNAILGQATESVRGVCYNA